MPAPLIPTSSLFAKTDQIKKFEFLAIPNIIADYHLNHEQEVVLGAVTDMWDNVVGLLRLRGLFKTYRASTVGRAAFGFINVIRPESISSGETFTLNDGVNPAKTFEYRHSGSPAPGNVAIDISAAITDTDVMNLTIQAINAAAPLGITAVTAAVINGMPAGSEMVLTNDVAPTTLSAANAQNVEIVDTVYDERFTHEGMKGALHRGATGRLGVPAKTSFMDGEFFTIPGLVDKTYEFDVGGDGVTPGRVAIDISAAVTDVDVVTAMLTAINGQTGSTDVTASSSAIAARGFVTALHPNFLVDGDLFTLNDGVNPAITFEFDKAGNGVAPGRTAINISASVNVQDVRAAMITAINGVALLDITASNPGFGGTVTLVNTTAGVVGNQAIVATVASPRFKYSGMSGGTQSILLVQAGNGTAFNEDITEQVASPLFTVQGMSGGMDAGWDVTDGHCAFAGYDVNLTNIPRLPAVVGKENFMKVRVTEERYTLESDPSIVKISLPGVAQTLSGPNQIRWTAKVLIEAHDAAPPDLAVSPRQQTLITDAVLTQLDSTNGQTQVPTTEVPVRVRKFGVFVEPIDFSLVVLKTGSSDEPGIGTGGMTGQLSVKPITPTHDAIVAVGGNNASGGVFTGTGTGHGARIFGGTGAGAAGLFVQGKAATGGMAIDASLSGITTGIAVIRATAGAFPVPGIVVTGGTAGGGGHGIVTTGGAGNAGISSTGGTSAGGHGGLFNAGTGSNGDGARGVGNGTGHGLKGNGGTGFTSNEESVGVHGTGGVNGLNIGIGVVGRGGTGVLGVASPAVIGGSEFTAFLGVGVAAIGGSGKPAMHAKSSASSGGPGMIAEARSANQNGLEAIPHGSGTGVYAATNGASGIAVRGVASHSNSTGVWAEASGASGFSTALIATASGTIPTATFNSVDGHVLYLLRLNSVGTGQAFAIEINSGVFMRAIVGGIDRFLVQYDATFGGIVGINGTPTVPLHVFTPAGQDAIVRIQSAANANKAQLQLREGVNDGLDFFYDSSANIGHIATANGAGQNKRLSFPRDSAEVNLFDQPALLKINELAAGEMLGMARWLERAGTPKTRVVAGSYVDLHATGATNTDAWVRVKAGVAIAFSGKAFNFADVQVQIRDTGGDVSAGSPGLTLDGPSGLSVRTTYYTYLLWNPAINSGTPKVGISPVAPDTSGRLPAGNLDPTHVYSATDGYTEDDTVYVGSWSTSNLGTGPENSVFGSCRIAPLSPGLRRVWFGNYGAAATFCSDSGTFTVSGSAATSKIHTVPTFTLPPVAKSFEIVLAYQISIGPSALCTVEILGPGHRAVDTPTTDGSGRGSRALLDVQPFANGNEKGGGSASWQIFNEATQSVGGTAPQAWFRVTRDSGTNLDYIIDYTVTVLSYEEDVNDLRHFDIFGA